MIVQLDFLNKLKSLGLNSYEAKLWTALLSLGTSTAGELSDVANVPRSRSYDVLEGLEKKGFIITRVGKPIKYLAIPPEEVLDRVKQKVKNEYLDKTKSMDSLKESDMMKELDLLHIKGVDFIEPSDITGSLKGRDKIYSHLNRMIKNAEKSIILVSSEEGIKRKLDNLNKSLEKANSKGVNINICAPHTNLKIKETFKTNLNLKNIEQLNARFCVVDNKEVLLMLMDDKELHEDLDVAIWLNSPFLANSLQTLIKLN